MDLKKSKKFDLLVVLGVGILIEGLIFATMLFITTFKEAISLFVGMIVISIFWGCFAYIASLERRDKYRDTQSQS